MATQLRTLAGPAPRRRRDSASTDRIRHDGPGMTETSPVSAQPAPRQRDIKTIRALLPYLWPAGAIELRWRVVTAHL